MKSFVIRKQRATKEVRVGLPLPSGLSTIPYNIGISVDNQVPHHLDWKKCKKKCKKNINGKMVKC
jgi:hypothetical protein